MSFGFDVGNFADAAHLAYRIYRDCYKVARGAPQEFQLLVSEVSTLSNSLKILQEDAKDPESSLVQAGDDRVKLVNDMVGNIKVTLNKMEKIARKYEIMGSTTVSKGKQMWTAFKWSFDWSTIENLRGKLNQHNTMMSLLLTQIGNSSLQKIQSSNHALESGIHEIRKLIDQAEHLKGSEGAPIPFLSFEHDDLLVKNDISRSSLSASLLKHAEMYQPWSTIGVGQWIETGTWWLLRAQLEIRPITTSGSTITKPAYVALIKASWILIDIIACHPQVSFVSSTTRGQIAALSAAIKQEFEKLKLDGLTIETLKSLKDEDLYIWEGSQGTALALRPQIAPPASSLETIWAVDGDEKCFFLGIARCKFTASRLNICIVMFLVHADGRALRLVAKLQNGEVMLDIPFTKPVEWEIGGSQVTVNREQIILDTQEEARRLSCLIEAATTYLSDRKADYFSVQAFTFWLVLVAAKLGYKKLQSALYPSLYPRSSALVQHDSPESQLYQVTASLDQKFREGEGISGPRCEFHGDGISSARGLGWLYWAIWIDNHHLVNLLMLEGMTSIRNPWHNLPPLHIAALYGHDAAAHAIVANSSEDARTLAREKDLKGCQPLYYAAWYGHEKVARSLLSWGAEVDNSTLLCQTALHVAAEQGHTNLVALLLDKGARGHARDLDEMTPLLLACESKRESTITLFAKKQLDFTHRDWRGRNAWQLAVFLGLPQSQDRRISQSTFDLMMQSFWAGEMPQAMPLRKQRRAIVSFTFIDGITLTLDSRYARFEHPAPLQSHLTHVFGRAIHFETASVHFPSRIAELHIIYACKTLDFSIHGRPRVANRSSRGPVVLDIHGGGKFQTWSMGSGSFKTFKNIATDPNAEEV